MDFRKILAGCILLSVAIGAAASPPIDIVVYPQFITPLGITMPDGPELFTSGGGLRVGGLYSPGRPSWLLLGGDAGYDLVGTSATDSSVSMISLNAAAGVNIPLSETISLRPLLSAGYTQSLWESSTAGQATAGLDLLLSWRISSQFSLTAGAGYVNRLGLFEGARVFLGTSFALGRGAKDPFTPVELRVDPVFPILYQHYDQGPFGKITLENSGSETLTNVRLSFFINNYMDAPRPFARFDRVGRGESVEAELLALFNNRILSVTEGERVAADITIEYLSIKQSYTQTMQETLQIHNRNALTWDDDRKAAAFVTARDPNVLRYARNTVSVQEETPLKAINTNFRAAMALFESFAVHGLTYVIDPQSAYEELSQDAMAIDFIQFPVQTLEYRAGDCDDLAILFNALLESVGIETAFLTIPGHIYSAFNLDMWPAEAQKTFGNLDNFIIEDDAVWVPVEITIIRRGFIDAWDVGARQWREAASRGEAEIILTRRAWQDYPPVASPGDGAVLSSMPDRGRLLSAYEGRIDAFISRSIFTREQELLDRIRQRDDPRSRNALGVLYARHGLHDKAAEQFERIAIRSASARVNLGNIAVLREDYRSALEHFEAALGLQPGNNAALLGTALARHNLNDPAGTAEAYMQLAEKDEELAERYAWLAGGSEAGTARASGVGEVAEVVWDE
jgi:tetratricopeptide (TPR) repeat protein